LSIAGMGAAAGLPGGALLGPALLIVMLGVDGTLYPIYGAKLNESIPSAQRATILSLLSAGFSMLMTVSFPAASYLPIPWIYLVTGGVALLLALIWALRKGHTNEKTPQEVPQV
ncbi:MAG TPA: hypothetical protein VD902_21295, partial [Symbiobacteriaceae bacterium]|nr:hypothetical protein [Symbiobacteriaceae bacterium]